MGRCILKTSSYATVIICFTSTAVGYHLYHQFIDAQFPRVANGIYDVRIDTKNGERVLALDDEVDSYCN